jgi:hypothetical protein
MQKAKAGDLPSIHELIDRLDGKAVQLIDRGDVPITELSDGELHAIASGAASENAQCETITGAAEARGLTANVR